MLKLIALGHANAEIGQRLYLSVRTVESHRAHVQQKTRKSSRAALVRYALEHGLVELVDGEPQAAIRLRPPSLAAFGVGGRSTPPPGAAAAARACRA